MIGLEKGMVLAETRLWNMKLSVTFTGFFSPVGIFFSGGMKAELFDFRYYLFLTFLIQ